MERLGFSASSVVAALVPFLCAVFGVALANLPVSFLGGLVPPPLLALMPVYFWCLVRPDLMPPAVAFLIGLLEDLLSGGPPGVWGASFVAAYALIDRQRESFAGLSGFGAILGFATAMLVTGSTAYVIVSLYYARLPPVAPLVVEITISVLFYIPAAAVLGWIHRRFVGPLRSDF
jgi:rod shape-determining protein MreD